MEVKMKDICENRITKQAMVQEMIEQYRATYVRTKHGMHFLQAVSVTHSKMGEQY